MYIRYFRICNPKQTLYIYKIAIYICIITSYDIPKHRRRECLFSRRSTETSELRVTGLCEGNPPVTGGFPSQRASNTENVSIWWRHHEIYGWKEIGHLRCMDDSNSYNLIFLCHPALLVTWSSNYSPLPAVSAGLQTYYHLHRQNHITPCRLDNYRETAWGRGSIACE